jgi:hypothetical protein
MVSRSVIADQWIQIRVLPTMCDILRPVRHDIGQEHSRQV